MDTLKTISTRVTPQTQPATVDQHANSEGGYVFRSDDLNRLRRFLSFGVEGGTFYASEKDLTIESSDLVLRLVCERGHDVLDTVVDMSVTGATVKQNPIMFTMAALAGAPDQDVRTATMAALPRVARTASQLFLFASYVEQFRGWGRGLRNSVARWYTTTSPNRLAYQIEKYGNRNGWNHGDLLRLAHPRPQALKRALDAALASEDPYTPEQRDYLTQVRAFAAKGKIAEAARLIAADGDWLHDEDADDIRAALDEDTARVALFTRALGSTEFTDGLPQTSRTAIALKSAETVNDTLAVIAGGQNLSWEMVNSDHLADPDVWTALILGGHVPVGAMLRNLAQLTGKGVIDPFGRNEATQKIVATLSDPEILRKGRVHPMSVLMAAATYASGRSLRGDGTWNPVSVINKALDDAFPLAFGAIEPDPDTSILLGIDVSGSMDTSHVAGLPMTARTAAVALGQALAVQFPVNVGVAFTGEGYGYRYGSRGSRPGPRDFLTPFDFDPTRRLVDVIDEASRLDFGRTDCALPVQYALDNNLRVDTFVILTDNETYAGSIHPHQALRRYREKTGISARMVSVAFQNNPHTIADPSDPLMLDIIGLNDNVVSTVANFARGLI